MPDLPSSSSFIPKRTAGTKVRQKRTRNFFLLSVVSYACLIAAPTASAAVYVYQLYTNRQFDQAVQNLDTAIGGFSEAEMARVLEFDKRLRFSRTLVDNHVSVVKAFETLEQTTASDVGFKSLSLARNGDGSLTVKADIMTPDFDTALFQRGAYKKDVNPITSAALADITFVPQTDDSMAERVLMAGTFDFSLDTVRFTAAPTANTVETTTPEEVTAEESTSNDVTESVDTTEASEELDVTNETL